MFVGKNISFDASVSLFFNGKNHHSLSNVIRKILTYNRYTYEQIRSYTISTQRFFDLGMTIGSFRYSFLYGEKFS